MFEGGFGIALSIFLLSIGFFYLSRLVDWTTVNLFIELDLIEVLVVFLFDISGLLLDEEVLNPFELLRIIQYLLMSYQIAFNRLLTFIMDA